MSPVDWTLHFGHGHIAPNLTSPQLKQSAQVIDAGFLLCGTNSELRSMQRNSAAYLQVLDPMASTMPRKMWVVNQNG